MTQNEKAERYELLVRQGDVIQSKISSLKSQNAGFNTKTEAYDVELARLNKNMARVENEILGLHDRY